MISPVFRNYAERILRELTRRYAGRPEIMAWQIDNELENNHCTCPACRTRFRDFLKNKYGTLDALNRAWGSEVWSGEISDWLQITPPLGEKRDPGWYNPAYMLDYERFGAACTAEYVAFQAAIIRAADPHTIVTTNACFCANLPDFHSEFSSLDVAAYDNYPPISLPEEEETQYSNAFALDFIRSFKKENFWILEQLGGHMGCWCPISPTPEPGMLEGYALQAVAHGADLLSFFRWRTAGTGAEMFCHGVLDHSNVPTRRLAELQKLIARLTLLPDLDRTELKSQVAMLYSSEQEFALKNQRQSDGFAYWTQLRLFHSACMGLGVNLDILRETEPLDRYRVVLVPTHFVTNPTVVSNLEKFVRRGGTAVITNRSGVQDQNGNCIVGQSLPTLLRPLCGCYVSEYDPIGKHWQQIRTSSGGEYRVTSWCDLLEPESAEVWARYADRFYAGTAAITRNHFGKGLVYYVGTIGENALYRTLMSEVFREQNIPLTETLPQGVELTTRSGEKSVYRFLFNNTVQGQHLKFGGKNLTLRPFEVKIQLEDGRILEEPEQQ